MRASVMAGRRAAVGVGRGGGGDGKTRHSAALKGEHCRVDMGTMRGHYLMLRPPTPQLMSHGASSMAGEAF